MTPPRHPNGPATGRPPVRAERGMVATSHYLASGAGLSMLRQGGSAVDAAIAANAVLCVAYPHMAGLGGDAFFLIHSPGEPVTALNASGPAAAAATPDFYAQHADSGIPARGGASALTVPGAVDGWREAHERHGRVPWSHLFDDAIALAREGVPVSRSLAEWSAQDVGVLGDDQDASAIFLQEGRAMREGDRLKNPALASTFAALAATGARAGFYEGAVAADICRSMAEKGSPLSRDDFAEFRAEWVEPIEGSYRGHRVVEFPPNTQGFAALQILALLDGFDVAAMGDGTADFYHHAAEAVKVAFADRDAWLTDPTFVDIPLDRLLSREYADERRLLIDPESSHIMEEVEAGVTFEGGSSSEAAGGDTCYLCVVDDSGLSVSLIQSIFHDFGSATVAGDSGIILQNRGSAFSLDASAANCLEPGKRTFHTLIPAMLFSSDDELELVFGSMGGEGQPQTHAALLMRLLDFGYDVQQAIEAPRWLMGRTWGVQSKDLSVEGRVADPVIAELERRGQPVKVLSDWNDNMGHAQAIRIDRESGFFEGGADPRGDGLAVGW